ncbi:MAG: DUF6122 family protein [Enterobacterales bacterium]|nr:DUF6122 family protein [Enterobacterales bacterium]
MLHILLHFLLPLVVTLLFFRENWRIVYLLMMFTMLVDLDHLLASPIYDPLRCSIGFHPLHRLPAIGIYAMLALIPKTRSIGLGLLLHMGLDSLDCQVTNAMWSN